MAGPFNGPSIDAAVVNAATDGASGPHYVDVTYTAPPGTSVDYASIFATGHGPTLSDGGTPIALGAPTPISMVADPATGILTATPIVVHPVNGVLSSADLQMLQNANPTTFRYDFPASTPWSPGTVTVTFAAGSWATSNGDQAPGQTFTFQVLGPTADLVQPTNGSGVDVNTLNGRTYIDVIFAAPPINFSIDWSQITSLTPIFTLTGPGAGTATVDTTQAPVVVSQTLRKVRYWINGSFTSGDVSLVFVPGGPPLTTLLGTVAGGTAPFADDAGPQSIDVPFPVAAGLVLDPTTISGVSQFTLGGTAIGSIVLDPTVAPQVLANGTTVRYRVAGAFGTTGTITVTFDHGHVVGPAGRGRLGDCRQHARHRRRHARHGHGGPPGERRLRGDDARRDAPGSDRPPGCTQLDHRVRRGDARRRRARDGRDRPELRPAAAGRRDHHPLPPQRRLRGRRRRDRELHAEYVGLHRPGRRGRSEHPRPSRPLHADAPRVPRRRPESDGGQLHRESHQPHRSFEAHDLGNGWRRECRHVADGAAAGKRRVPDLHDGHVLDWPRHRHLRRRRVQRHALRECRRDRVVYRPGPQRLAREPGSGAVVGTNAIDTEGYLDVAFTAPAGKTIDPATITDATQEFTLSGTGTADWSIDTTKAPILVSTSGNTSVYRYWTTGTYTSGTVSITFDTGSYGFTDNSTSTFTGPVAPTSFLVDGVATPNIHYVDVLLTPTSGDSLDVSSITDTAPEFALTGPGAGSVQLLPDAAPTLLPGTATYRYYVGGAFAPGLVTVGFIAGSFASGAYTNLALDDHLTVGELTATFVNPDHGGITGIATLKNQGFVDVTFTVPTGFDSLDVSSITDSAPEFTLAAGAGAIGTIALDTTQAPIRIGTGYTFRYFTTGTMESGTVVLTYIPNSVTALTTAGQGTTIDNGSTTTSIQTTLTAVFSGDTYIDVQFTQVGNIPIGFGASNAPPAVTLTGTGVGTAALDAAKAPTVSADGTTVRYYVSGQFQAGIVNVAIAAGSYQDSSGDLGSASTGTFKLIDQLQNGGSGSRVFFISLSGGENLQAGGLFGDTPEEPLLAIRGMVELQIGTVMQSDGSMVNRFELTASGTMTVIKLGNIASGAAVFILQTSDGLSNIEFWGVAAIQTNFDFLQQYGIFLSGSALIEVNTTSSAKVVPLSLEGVPGDAIFAEGSSQYTSLIAALPTDTFNKVSLSSAWANLFANPGSDRNADGIADSGPLTLELSTGQDLTLADFGGVTLQNAQIEGVIAGKEWKILNGDGKQYFIKVAADADANPILVVSGEERTYNLAPQSFEIEVIGSMTIYDPSTLNDAHPSEWVHIDGGFQLKITSTETTFFFTAGGSITPLAISGRMTGLLILQYQGQTAQGIPGIAGTFTVDIGAGVPPGASSGTGLGSISNIFSFRGSVRVTLNTTLENQVFVVPPEFIAVLPSGFAATITIPQSAPEIDGSTSSNLNARGAYLQAVVTGTITLGNVIDLTGAVAITYQVGTPSFVRIQGAVQTTIQFLGALSGSIDLGFYSSFPTDPTNAFDPGIIGRVSLSRDADLIPGVSIGGAFVLEVNLFLNTTADANTITFMTRAEAGQSCSADTCALLATNPDGSLKTGTVTIHNGLRLLLDGHMTIANIVEVDGAFTFTFSANPFVIQVTAVASLQLHGLGTLGGGGIQFQGAFRIDSDGLAFITTISAGAMGNFGSGVGLGFNASATISFNTASFTKTIDDGLGHTFHIQSGFLVAISGDVDFLGIVQASGSVTIAISAGQFTLDFDVDITLGPLDLHASGFAGIYTTAGHSGLVLQLDVAINFDILDIVKITGNGQIRLNTTPDSHTANGVTMGAHSFELYINGTISLLDVIKVNTTVLVVVGGDQHVMAGPGDTAVDEVIHEGEWFFDFSGDADFFGLAKLHADGWVDSSGHFGVDLNGGITIGSSSFGLHGDFDVHAWLTEVSCSTATIDQQTQYCSHAHPTEGKFYSFGVAFSANVDVNAFGFSLASVGIGARLTAAGTGTVDLVASVHFHISFLFFTFSATAHFDIGTVQLPKPIYLAGGAGCDTNSSTCQPFLAADLDWDANDGVTTTPEPLYVNVGDRASGRGIGEDQPDEAVTVDHISGVAGDEKVQITMFGHSQTFSHVSAIYADTGAGDDTIVVDKGVLSAVHLFGGTGDDVILYDGSGGGDIHGGDGNDIIQIGPDAGGVITVNGDGGQDYITDSSSDPTVTLSGGDDGDTIIGGLGIGEALNGDGGDDLISVNSSTDIVTGGTGNDTIVLNSLPTGSMPTISGGGDGNDVLAVHGSAGADSIHIFKPAGADVELDSATGSVTATGIHELDVSLSNGGDTAVIDNLDTSSVVLVNIDVGASDHAADTVTINGGSGNDSFTISGNDPAAGIEVVHTIAGETRAGQVYVQNTLRGNGDSLTVNGLDGADTIDASALGSSSTTSTTTFPVDLVALTITGGSGDDRLIGSPFADVIKGGTGNDTMTGGPGLDQFFSDNVAGDGTTTTLVESMNTDLALYGNTFVSGTALNDAGTVGYAQSAGGLESESDLAAAMAATEDPSFRQPGYGEQWSASSVVENLKGIFQVALLTGGNGNNTMVVNAIDGTIWVGGVARTVTTWNGHAILDNASNTSNTLPEYYVITIKPGSAAVIDINDSGGGSGQNDVVVFGSNQPDTVQLNSAGSGAFAVGFVLATVTSQTNISFQGVQRLEVFLLGGNDNVLSNDTAVTTIVDLGSGDDSIVVGTVPLVPDPGNRSLEFPEGVPVADTKHMTNGNTAPMFALGGTQNDNFEVDHNRGMLYLAGDAGDDTFLLKTFLVLRENPNQPDEITNLTTLFGGSGSNRYEYLQNAPVFINGGSGFDTIVIDGTPLDDTFVITSTYVAGAGRIVNFVNIESASRSTVAAATTASGSSTPTRASRSRSTAAPATTRSTSAAPRRRSCSTRRRSPTRRRRTRSTCRRRSSTTTSRRRSTASASRSTSSTGSPMADRSASATRPPPRTRSARTSTPSSARSRRSSR